MQRKYFGTDGIRGRVGETPINAEFMSKLGRAAGTVFLQDNIENVLIGHDTRVSWAMLESALQDGFTSAGVQVKLLGALPTPGVAYLTRSLKSSAGIVISASHNPYYDNGVKFFDRNGMKLSDKLELAIEKRLEESFSTTSSEPLGTVERFPEAAREYIDFCKSIFPSENDLNNVRIVVDCANGATFDVAPTVFHELAAEVIPIHNTPDGMNINDKCGATDVGSLQEGVKAHRADVGLAFDGDGDRLIMVDHQGEVVDGDEILCILAKDRFSDSENSLGVVGTVMSNLGLEQALAKSGITFERTSVGDRYVLEALLKKGWTLGGEASGHIVDLNYATTGDGIITALQVLRVMRAHNKSLHELKCGMMKRPQVLVNVPVMKVVDLKDYPKIAAAVMQVEKQLNGKGRVLLRPSGTEPAIRIMVEGNSEREVREAAESLAATVKRCIEQ